MAGGGGGAACAVTVSRTVFPLLCDRDAFRRRCVMMISARQHHRRRNSGGDEEPDRGERQQEREAPPPWSQHLRPSRFVRERVPQVGDELARRRIPLRRILVESASKDRVDLVR